MIVVDTVFIMLGVLSALIMVYLFFLAFVSFLPERHGKEISSEVLNLAVIIPAHNESLMIGETLENLKKSDYPADSCEIIVVADNCDDDTAAIAESHGVSCLRRQDHENRGKGNVLKWVFPRLLQSGRHDAFVIIDGDTHLAPDFLRRVNGHFVRGAQVVQGYSQVRHPERSIMESMAFLGFALNRNLRYRGRSRLGWTSNLMGTGMCFRREIIEKYGWNTTTMVEDIEYEMMLQLHGVRVKFAPDARISVELHRGVEQSQAQRTRWDMGKFEVRNRYLLPLLKKGLVQKDLAYFDSAMELLLPPFSLLFLLIFGGGISSLVLASCGAAPGLYLWLGVMASMILYIFIGIITSGAEPRIYRALMFAPFFAVWRLWIVLLEGVKKNNSRQW